MITRIVIENFKSLRKVDLALGRVNLFIGTNASGKSNFLDALRVLQGMGNGFTVKETLDGKPRSATNEIWEGIRGGSAYACLAGADELTGVTITVHGKLDETSSPHWKFQLSFLPVEGKVTSEELVTSETKHTIYETSYLSPLDSFRMMTKDQIRQHLPLFNSRSTFWERHRNSAGDPAPDHIPVMSILRSFANTQRIAPEPRTLRSYSQSDQAQRMGDHGENFAALVSVICQDPGTKDAYLSWLRQLRPEEIHDVGTLSGALGEPMFLLRENGREYPAPVLSDGTLRFAALAAAFFQPDMPDIMTIEEIENGIHASRVQLLLDLFRSQAEFAKTQVVATTHSPAVLDWLQEDDYRTTFLCIRDEETGESRLCCLADIPHFLDAAKKTPVSELFAEGWLETTA